MNFDTEIKDITFLPSSLIIPINSNLEFQLLTEEVIVTNFLKADLNFIQSAFANGCDNTYNPIKKIININIMSSEDFSPQHPTGSSLNSIVNVQYFNGSEMVDVNSGLNEYLNWINQLGSPGRSAFNFETFSITERPESNQELSLIVEFNFTDNSSFTLETEKIIWE